MAYNPYEAVSRIFNLKGEWDSATMAGDTQRADRAAQAAQAYYAQLRNNNYGSVADELASKDFEQSKYVKDYYAKTGNTEFRPYMYSLGSKYGMSQADVDKLIKWDEGTGEITFGGKNLGKPFAVVDGSSYIKDTSILDNAFGEYAGRTGLTRPTSSMVNQENESLFKKYNEEYDYLKNTNPFETETGKSILERYDLKGLQGRDNEVASGASANSGNIDSFSAANALRQQASLRNMGEQTALSAHQQRLQNAQSLLSQMGVNINNVFNQDQTAQNNQVARDTQKIQNDLAVAETFGRATSNQYTNPYIGQNMDFKAAYDQAKANGASAEVLNQLAEARFMKQVSMNDFSAGFIPFEPTSRETANMLLTNKQIDSAERISGSTLDSNERLTNAQIASAERIASGTNQSAIDQIKAQTEGQKELLAEQAKYSTTGENTTLPADFKPRLTAAQSREAIEGGNITQSTVNDYNYWHGTNHTVDTINKGSEIEDSESSITQVYDSAKKKQQQFMNLFLLNKGSIGEEELKNLVIEKSKDYDLEVDFIQKLFNAYGFSAAWLSEYKNSGLFGWGSGIKQK